MVSIFASGYLKRQKKNKLYIQKEGFYFKTGDYVEIKNGEMYFKIEDRQVKIKGNRIELDDITVV